MTEDLVRRLSETLGKQYPHLLMAFARGMSEHGPGFLVASVEDNFVPENPPVLKYRSRSDWYGMAVYHLQDPAKAFELSNLIGLSEEVLRQSRVQRSIPVVLHRGMKDDLELTFLSLTPPPGLNPGLLVGLYLPN